MINKKIYDASVLINILEELDFMEIFTLWDQNPRYEQWITHEVNREIIRLAPRSQLDRLIEKKIINIFDPIPKDILEQININFPRLSVADCSLFYYCNKEDNTICLTNDKPLRNYLEEKSLFCSGTIGIYKKLKRDNSFPLSEIEDKFALLLQDPRVFPKDSSEESR